MLNIPLTTIYRVEMLYSLRTVHFLFVVISRKEQRLKRLMTEERSFAGDLIYDFTRCLLTEREKTINHKIVFNKLIKFNILVFRMLF